MRTRFLLLILLIGMAFQPAWNQTVQIEELKAETLLKLLSQNRSLDYSQIDTVRMALVYDRSDARSQSEAENYRRLFLNNPRLPFKGKPLQIESEPNSSPLFGIRRIIHDHGFHLDCAGRFRCSGN